MITLFKQNRIRKYYYLVFLPLYFTLGLLRVLKLLPKKYILFGAGGGSQFIDNSKYSYLLNKNQNLGPCVLHRHVTFMYKTLRDTQGGPIWTRFQCILIRV